VLRRASANPTRAIAACATILVVAALSACGSGSSKPAYCAQVDDFKSAVQGLKSVNAGQGELASGVQKVGTTGNAAVSAVKNQYPEQTAAVKSAISGLADTTKQLQNPATRRSALQQMPAQVTAIKTATSNFSDATSSKCA
jgi:uncharacterized phage infection (PIP) family protein YhgE